MRALRVTAFGKTPKIEDIARPDPGPDQVRVRISACGLNFADLLMLDGTYQETPAPPFTAGMEVAGVIDDLGSGVETLRVGDRVAVFAGHGGLAEYGVFDASRTVAIPDAMPFEVAAGFLVAYGTSHLALTHRARLSRGERLVVLGASGGVGLTAVELGAAMGAEVIAVARGQKKLAAALAAGANHALDPDTADLRAEIRALGGAHVVYDAVGGDMFRDAFRATNPEGRILVIGFASGTLPEIAANHLLVKNIDVMGVYWGGYMKFAPDILTGSLSDLMDLYAAGALKPQIGATRSFEHALEALELLRTRQVPGKIVVTMDDAQS